MFTNEVEGNEEITESIGEDDSYKEFEGFPTINFIEEGRCLEIPETLEEALGQALIDKQIGEFVTTYMAEYRILTDEEREEYIQSDSAGILKDYMESTTVEDDVWFGFMDSPICIIRHPIGQGEYAYYEYLPAGVVEEFAYVMRALGKNEEYFFVQWEGKVYVITTKREAGNLVGIATYCMQGEAIYGWMMYQEKLADNSISTKYYGYTYTAGKEFGTHWPDY